MMERTHDSRLAFWLGAVLLIGVSVNQGFAQTLRMEHQVSPKAGAPSASGLSLSDLLRLSLEQNPALAQAESDISAAQAQPSRPAFIPTPR